MLTAWLGGALSSFARARLICAVPSAVPPAGAGPPPRIYRWEKTTVVAVKIKLKRLGKIREPYYRIVVADARTKRDGRAIEEIGKYHPKAEPSLIEVNSERVRHWLSVGAQPTDPVRVLLKITGDWQKFTGQAGTEGTLKKAEPRADKKDRFASVAKESQAVKAAKEDKGAGKAAAQSRPARPAKDSAAKDSAPKDAPAKDTPAKDAPAKATPTREGKATAGQAASGDGAPKGGRAKAAAADVKAAAETAPVVAEAAPVESEAAPVVAEAAPVVAEAAPVVAEAAPVVAEAAPVVAEAAAPEEAAVTEADDGEPGSGA